MSSNQSTNEEQVATLRRLTDGDVREFSLEGIECPGKIVDIYDGDTCKIILLLDGKYQKFNCRLFGIDTPEMKPSASKPNRDAEVAAAKKCRNRFIQLGTDCTYSVDDVMSKSSSIRELMKANTKVVRIDCGAFDKYGRLLVKICDIDTKEYVNDILVKEGYAKTYYGGTKESY